MPSKQGQLRIGASGYQYDHWRGVFYPEDTPKRAWFAHYAEHFDTVEINNTFYNLPKAETFDDWRNAAPDGFRYALKFSRHGTHMKKLKDPAQPIEAFLDRAERLGEHLGPILVQLPPHWGVNVERLAGFLEAATERGGQHRWAVEVREDDWLCDDVYDALREHNAALCVHDMIDDHPRVRTADWMYLRFHGPPDAGKYAGCYPHQALTAEARRIQGDLDAGLDVFAFFNNDAEGHAVRNALDLRRYLMNA